MAAPINITALGIQEKFDTAQRLYTKAMSLKGELAIRRDDISFKQLFQAVLSLERPSPDSLSCV